MKKNVFLAAALLALTATAVFAQTGKWQVKVVNNNERSIVGYTDPHVTSIAIPRKLDSNGENWSGSQNLLPVTSIGAVAFKCPKLASVTIPDSITFIGARAFYGCGSLTSVTFEGTVKDFAVDAFPGDLRDKYLAGGAGTYTRSGSGSKASPFTWTKK